MLKQVRAVDVISTAGAPSCPAAAGRALALISELAKLAALVGDVHWIEDRGAQARRESGSVPLSRSG